ncbi:MAG: ABC transporter permease, partial [Verrucomicrobiota bacterium]
FLGYFRSPVAYVFLIVFLFASVGLAFFAGGFFKAGIATMESYFSFHPWLFLFLVPAAGMRLWSEEKRAGTVELLFTLPITIIEAVLGKFLAAWLFLAIAILLSFPMALTLSYLGNPDWGVIVSGYVGSIMMAGGYLGVCSLMSALTKNQVIAFVLSVFVCVMLVLLGTSMFSGFMTGALGMPVALADVIANFSFFTHFDAFTKGIIDPKDVIFFLSLMGFTLFLNVVALER